MEIKKASLVVPLWIIAVALAVPQLKNLHKSLDTRIQHQSKFFEFKETDLHAGAEWLVGRTLIPRELWGSEKRLAPLGLPLEAKYTGGRSLPRKYSRRHVSDELGFNSYDINGSYFALFTEVTDRDIEGRPINLVLDAVKLNTGLTMSPCKFKDEKSGWVFAFLDPDEADFVSDQKPSQYDNRKATLGNPKQSYLFDPHKKKIIRLDSRHVTCYGFLWEARVAL